jgi:hypothetical protein
MFLSLRIQNDDGGCPGDYILLESIFLLFHVYPYRNEPIMSNTLDLFILPGSSIQLLTPYSLGVEKVHKD